MAARCRVAGTVEAAQVSTQKPYLVLAELPVVMVVRRIIADEIVRTILAQDAIECAVEIVGVLDHESPGFRGQNAEGAHGSTRPGGGRAAATGETTCVMRRPPIRNVQACDVHGEHPRACTLS